MERPTSNVVIAATGLLFEARIAELSKGVKAVVSGGRGEALEQRLLAAINAGGRAIISFGIAGGLKPGLTSGDVIVPAHVLDVDEEHRSAMARPDDTAPSPQLFHQGARELHRSLRQSHDGAFETDAVWRARLISSLSNAVIADVVGCEAPVATAAAKRALFEDTRASAADMESHIAARVAHAHGLPFAALRVIADSANRDVPPAALVGMKEDGNADIAAVLKNLARRPTQLPALLRVGVDTGRAKASLLRCLGLLGPGLGFFDL